MGGEGTFGEDISTLLFGTYVPEFQERILKKSVEKPVEVYAVSATYVAHGWTPTFDAHLDNCFVILQEV